ncbi:MAG: protease modulator HflC [Pseudomonadota bacterium]|nr:protease modulator HflC [Pseudomonadota bacterium]
MKNQDTNSLFQSFLLIFLVGFLILLSSVFYVYEGNRALVQRFGKILTRPNGDFIIYEPGLHFKVPVIDSVQPLDIRIQTFSVPSDRIFTVEQKSVKIDYYVKWKIKDLVKYYLATNASSSRTASVLKGKINDVLRAEVGKRELSDVITGERGSIISILKDQADTSADNIGVEVVDVRIVKLDYPPEVSQSVYERMRASRQRMATMYRSEGDAASEAIRAKGDAEVVKILAEAKRSAAVIKAEGDAEAADIFTSAYSKQPDFFRILRTLDVYKKTIKEGESMIIDLSQIDIFKPLQSGSLLPSSEKE